MGDRLCHDGERCDRVAFVIEGEVRVTKAGAGGREIELYRITAGEPCILELSAAMSDAGPPGRPRLPAAKP